jgi:hypothetical protein
MSTPLVNEAARRLLQGEAAKLFAGRDPRCRPGSRLGVCPCRRLKNEARSVVNRWSGGVVLAVGIAVGGAEAETSGYGSPRDEAPHRRR